MSGAENGDLLDFDIFDSVVSVHLRAFDFCLAVIHSCDSFR